MLDICSCLISVLQDRPELTGQVLQMGFVRKMKETLESYNPASQVYELALLVLCAVLRSPVLVHRAVVIRSALVTTSLTGGTATHAPTGVSGEKGFPSGAHVFGGAFANASLNAGGASAGASTSVDMNSFTFGAGVNAPAGGFSFGSEDQQGWGDDPRDHPPVIPADSFLAHAVRHLGRTENVLTRSDILRSLLCVLDLGTGYGETLAVCGIEGMIEKIMHQDVHDLKLEAGKKCV